jgi:hypothetical protein
MYFYCPHITNFILVDMLRKLQNVLILTRAKIYTLNPTRFALTCIDGDFDELELCDVLVAKRKEPIPVNGFGAPSTNPNRFRI